MILISHHANVLLGSREQSQNFVLHSIRVLIFIHVDVAEPRLPPRPHRGSLPQKFRGAKKQVIEIDCVALRQQLLVRRVYPRCAPSVFPNGLRFHDLRRLGVIFGAADPAQDVLWRKLFLGHLQLSKNKLHHSQLVFFVEYGKVAS